MADIVPVVFVIDDDISVRESLESLIKQAGWRPEVFASAGAFLARQRIFSPSCLVLDVSLPEINGLDLQRMIADRVDMPIIFITGHGDVPTTVRAMRGGALEFLTKPFGPDELLEVIRQAFELSRLTLGNEEHLTAIRTSLASLTPREKEVLELVVSGLLNKQVGGKLGISEITVKAHRGSMMRKMGAESFAELVTMSSKVLGDPSPRR
jgi:FixJ family two-component response regulator